MATPRSILFFADGSQETHSGLRKILNAQTEGSLLSRFLNLVASALQNEVYNVASVDRDGLPDFHNLHGMVQEDFEESARHPALHPTEIVLVQLANFIAKHEGPEERYPNVEYDIVVGVCFGELSAAAVSVATSITELIPLAVDSVRLAFRAGMAAFAVASSLEPRINPAQSWSMTISRESGMDDEEKLNLLGEQLGIPEYYRPYITSSSRKTVTLGCPPSTLSTLILHLSKNNDGGSYVPRKVPIYAPYHAHRYFSWEDIGNLLEMPGLSSSFYNDQNWPRDAKKFIGAATGKYYSPRSRKELLHRVLYNILAQPIRWEEVVNACRVSIESSHVSCWTVRPIAQTNLAKSLFSSLRATGNVQMTFEDSFSSHGSRSPRTRNFPVAIVGMSGRFPQAEDIDEFWDLLQAGVDCHKEIPVDRFDPKKHLKQPGYGCFLEHPGLFDSRFFNMSPRECLETDPGQRLALVTAYEALEMSGFVPNRTPSTQLDRIGTFNGQVADEYKEQNLPQQIGPYFIPGSMRAFATGRINYFFKFGGPAISLDTACSTSLVALHTACNSIWKGDCDTAIVGGMNIISSHDNYIGLSTGHFISPTGGCKTWDEAADGYCRGEAVTSVVLKSLKAAEDDNDLVLGVILSAGTNYSANADSITRPHAPAQEELYRALLRDAGLQYTDVDYIEMHGTGTQAGDVAEMTSVCNVFAPELPVRPPDNPLHIGAVKSNIGHSEAASGVTALIKSLMVLRDGILPPHVGIKNRINPKLPNLQRRNVIIPFKNTVLPQKSGQGVKRRILVNNFSAAGGNAAMVLEDPPAKNIVGNRDKRSHHVVCISGKSSHSLTTNGRNLMSYLEKHPDVALSDLAYTTTARRIHHSLRQAFLADSVPQLKDQIARYLSDTSQSSQKKISRIALCFTGQGPFYMPLGRDLLQDNKGFREDIFRFDRLSKAHGFESFLPIIEDSGGTLKITEVQKQLSILAVEMALYRLLGSLGVRATLVIGHSLGEYGALYASGVLSASDALYLVGHRARILENMPQSNECGMLAVQANQENIRALQNTHGALEIACINGPKDVVLSGPLSACKTARVQFQEKSIACQLLPVTFAYHSSHVDSVLPELEKIANKVHFGQPKIPFISPVRETVISEAGTIDSSYLRDQTRRSVLFYGALLKCQEKGLIDENTVWLEIGPKPLCINMIKASIGSHIRALPTLKDNEKPWATLGKLLASLYTWGFDINWQAYHQDFESTKTLLALPSYAWDNKDYWIAFRDDSPSGPPAQTELPSRKITATGPNTTTIQRLVSGEIKGSILELLFKTDLMEPKICALITGHVMNGCALCPASVYADMAATIADYIRREFKIESSSSGIAVGPMEIKHPIAIPKEVPQSEMVLHIKAVVDLSIGKGTLEFSVISERGSTGRVVNATCSIKYADSKKWLNKWMQTSYLIKGRIKSLELGIKSSNTQKFLRDTAYRLFSSTVEYSPNYQGMQEIFIDTEELEAVALLQLCCETNVGFFFCNPLWIDSIMQLSGFVMNSLKLDSGASFIADGWESFQLAQELNASRAYRIHVKMQSMQENLFVGDLSLFEDDYVKVGMVKGLRFRIIPRSLLDFLILRERPPVENQQFSNTSPNSDSLKQSSKPQQLYDIKKEAHENQKHSTDIWRDVLNIITQEVGLPAWQIEKENELSILGIDSLLSLTIVSNLQERLQIDVPRTLFEDCSTFEDLRVYFNNITSATTHSGKTYAASEVMLTPSASQAGSGITDKITAFRSLIAQEIGIPADDLHDTEDLSAMGLDSLMALTIVGAAREQLGIKISPDILSSQSFSILEIEKTIGLSAQSTSRQPAPSLSVLLQGEPKTAQKTLFLFPDGSGSASSYIKLPVTDLNLVIYGLNSPYLKAGPNSTFDVEDLVRAWVQEMQNRQPKGPYIIGGWSSGGYYSFEAAKLLIDAGEQVQKLILIDVPPRNVYEAMPKEVLQWLAQNNIMGAGASSPSWLVQHFESTLTAVDKYTPTPLSDGVPEVYIIWASDSVISQSDAKPDLDLRVHVSRFLLQKREDFGGNGWEKLLPGSKIFVTKAPGSHFSITMPPNATKLSHLIAAAVGGDPLGVYSYWPVPDCDYCRY